MIFRACAFETQGKVNLHGIDTILYGERLPISTSKSGRVQFLAHILVASN